MSSISYGVVKSAALTVGTAVGALAVYWLCSKTSKKSFDFCHGSTFSALYMLSKMKGKDKNCLVPFGQLEEQRIPTFSGECLRGIAAHRNDVGVNRQKTSWMKIDNDLGAVGYSRRFPFSLEEDIAELESIITDNQEYLDGTGRSRPPYSTQGHSAYWNKTLLRIRRVRAWDEGMFKARLKSDLQRWIFSEQSYFNELGNKYATTQEREDRLVFMQKIQEEIEAPPGLQLSKEDRERIAETYPIVFLASEKQGFEFIPSVLNEYAFSGNLKLGEDICGIATESQHVEGLEAYLKLQGLAKKVDVISFPALALEKWNKTLESGLKSRL